MSAYKKSKKVKAGMLCSRHGAWVIPAKKGSKIVGVWRDSIIGTMRLPDGTVQKIYVPAGLVIAGDVSVACG